MDITMNYREIIDEENLENFDLEAMMSEEDKKDYEYFLNEDGSRQLKEFTVFDKIAVRSAMLMLDAGNFLIDDLLNGGLKEKRRKKREQRKNKNSFFEDKEPSDEEKKYGSEIIIVPDPIIVENATDEKKIFTVVPDEEPTEKVLNNTFVNELIKKYNFSDKLLAATLLWLCGKISDQQLGGIVAALDKNELYKRDNLQFINSVSKYFANRLFVAGPEYKDIPFNVEPTSLKFIVQDISGLDILKGNNVLSVIIDKTRDYVQKKTGEYVLLFDNSKLDLFKNNAPDKLVKRVEEVFGKYLVGAKYQIIKTPGGMVKLMLTYNPALSPREFVIDPGIAFGSGFKVMGFDEYGCTTFVSPEVNDDIVYNIFGNIDYRIPWAELPRILDKQKNFRQYDLYVNFDFSSIYDKLDALKAEDRTHLQDKLYMVRAIVGNEYKITPRMRFKNFKDIDNFIIVSDDKCNVQYPEEMVSDIIPGLKIKVSNDKYEVSFSDASGNLTSVQEFTFPQSAATVLRTKKPNYESLKKAQTILNTAVIKDEEANPTVKVDFRQK